jgi:Family of unknown function (DUF5675)
MKITLERKYKKASYTIGKLYIDGVYFCDTLEDTDRGLKQSDPLTTLKSKKVYGETAIPTGTYKITMDVVSPKFASKSWAAFCGGKLPRLIDVPAYDGVLIHVGNKPADTLGCILVGENKTKGQVNNSTVTFKKLYEKLAKDKNNLTITIQ